MIQPTRSARKLANGGLRALHVSLNSPVVALELLPTGPASAAVAQDAAGALVCLRSVRARQTRFFASTDDLAATPALALEAALSFAESMGFLFDDDEVRLRGPEGAAQLWEEISGDAAPGASLAPAEVEEPDDPADDARWLDEWVGAVTDDALSKFRFFARARGMAPGDGA
jgi:hypothetical protein